MTINSTRDQRVSIRLRRHRRAQAAPIDHQPSYRRAEQLRALARSRSAGPYLPGYRLIGPKHDEVRISTGSAKLMLDTAGTVPTQEVKRPHDQQCPMVL